MATGNICREFGEIERVVLRYVNRETNRQTD